MRLARQVLVVAGGSSRGAPWLFCTRPAPRPWANPSGFFAAVVIALSVSERGEERLTVVAGAMGHPA